MPITDDRTPNLDLPLPYADNMLEDDSDRIRTSLTMIDAAVAGKASNESIVDVNTALTLKADLVAGKVPSSQLPAYVDDVLEYENFAALPAVGESGKIYVLQTPYTTGGYTCTQFRWSGSAYVPIPNSPGSTDVVPEGATNKYFTDARAVAAIPVASPSVAGKIKVGAGLGIDGAGTLFASTGGGSVMSVVDVVPASNGLSTVPIPSGYVVGAILLAVNGSLLGASDYTALTGNSVTLIGMTVGTVDTLTVISLATVSIGSLPVGSVGTTQLADGAVTTAKLGAIASINGGQLAGLRNRIINGNFGINQRGVSGTVTLASGAYGHDRWKAGASGCTYTFSTTANVTTLTITAGSLIQVIEGLNLESGTYALSWSGTSTGKIGAGSYSASGLTGAITGGANTNIEFSTGTLSKVHLEFGSVNTVFEQRPYGLELVLCQRYYTKVAGKIVGYFNTSVDFIGVLSIPVPMRAAPSVTFMGTVAHFYINRAGTASTTMSSITSVVAYDSTIELRGVPTSAGTTGQGTVGTLESTAYIAVSAEF